MANKYYLTNKVQPGEIKPGFADAAKALAEADDLVAYGIRRGLMSYPHGTEFDATDPKGEPATFPLRGVVPGWQEALPLMKVGSKWKLYVPPALGYGEEGSPPVIEPNEVLVFEIELVKIASP